MSTLDILNYFYEQQLLGRNLVLESDLKRFPGAQETVHELVTRGEIQRILQGVYVLATRRWFVDISVEDVRAELRRDYRIPEDILMALPFSVVDSYLTPGEELRIQANTKCPWRYTLPYVTVNL